jgi:hypothetical protein
MTDSPRTTTAPSATDGDGDQPGARGGPTAPRRRRPVRTLLTLVVLALVAMWVYVIYLAVGPGRQPPIDRLDDPAFAEAAEPRCADALEVIGELPVANATPDAADRADVIEQANVAFGSMLDDLDDLVDLAPAGDQRERATAWLADWRTYLGDRQQYADALRVDADARLLVSEKAGEGRQITGWIDEFARANRMPSCVTPGDV